MKKKPVILLIDDDEDDHQIFKLAAKNVEPNCELHNAFSPEQGLQLLKSVAPEFIFLDMHMPRLNGIEFLLKLRDRYNEFPFCVIMFSTGMTEELCEQATQNGATYCVRKPYSIKELENILVQVCIERNAPSSGYLF